MKQKAFTLIELLVVMAIIGVIASIVLVNLRGTREKAHVAKGLSFSQSINHALGAYAVGIYRFESVNNGGLTTPDSSGYGNTLWVMGGLFVLTEGIIGNGIHFGSAYTVSSGAYPVNNFNFSETNEITIEAWFKLTEHSLSNEEGIVAIEDTGSNYVYTIMVDPNYHPLYNPGSYVTDQVITDFTFELDKWYHYVMVVKGGREAEIYINGKSIRKSSDGVPATLPNGSEIQVGVKPPLDIQGIIDEVRIYNQAFNL